MLVIALLLFTISVKADSGWDGGYDSGGGSYDSGSSWDSGGSDWSSDGNSGGSWNGGPVETVLLIITYIIIIYAFYKFYKWLSHGHRRILREPMSRENYRISEGDTSLLRKYIPNYSKPTFTTKLYEIYKDIQIAWMNFDYDSLKTLTNDELFNTYKSQLETLKLKNGQNIMSDFDLNDMEIVNVSETDVALIVEVAALIECHDYVIDTSNNKVTRGNKFSKVLYDYRMTFIGPKQIADNICPNCGAELDGTNRTTCSYCKSVVINKSYNWVLSKKRVISQSRK